MKTCFDISKLRRVGNAVSVGAHAPQWGRFAPGSHGVGGLWRGPGHYGEREVL